MDFIFSLVGGLKAKVKHPDIPWQKVVATILVIQFSFENWVLLRQYLALSNKNIPKPIQKLTNKVTFDESQAYSRSRARSTFVESTCNFLINIVLVRFNGFLVLWMFSGRLLKLSPLASNGSDTMQSLVFLCLHSTITLIVMFFSSFYSTFFIEEKFGFNRTDIQTWVKDQVKLSALIYILRVISGIGILTIVKHTGDLFFLYLWLFIGAFLVLMLSISSTLVLPWFFTLKPLEQEPLRQRIEKLAFTLGFPLSDLRVIDSSSRSAHSNACFIGFPWKKSIVLFDTLIEQASIEEVEAVVAHELGHWKGGHSWRTMLLTQIHLGYTYCLFPLFLKNQSFFKAFGFIDARPIAVGLQLYLLLLNCTDPLVRAAGMRVARSHEYEADSFASNLGYARPLGSALIKINSNSLKFTNIDWLYSSLHHTHPTLLERLTALGWEDKSDGGDSEAG